MTDHLGVAERKVISVQELESKLRKGVSEKKDLLISEFVPVSAIDSTRVYTRRERTISVEKLQDGLGIQIGTGKYVGYYQIVTRNLESIVEDKVGFFLFYAGGHVQKISLQPRLYKKDYKLDVDDNTKWQIKQSMGYSSTLGEFYNWVQKLIGYNLKLSVGKDATDLNTVRGQKEEVIKQGVITKVYGDWNNFCIELDNDFRTVERFTTDGIEEVFTGSTGAVFMVHRSCQYKKVQIFSSVNQ
ncbi:hypothetical protein [Bacillus toyonensis]|uniref:hypothetical protein n=1 Tax=Bacillus toyonensis TaxID=155322 RepID=UPI000BF9AECA|nr:hypothetical protein [Bacillus toyonensis]PGF05165.1 hypothetical protein COM61_01715 [Bacillus toyonensis]